MKSDKSKILFSMFTKLEKPNKIRRAADSQLTVSTESSTVYFAVSGAQSLTQNSLRIKGVGWVGNENN
jgi:hypothetical protein